MIEIKSTERKDNKKGLWMVINYINDKGESKVTNSFDEDLILNQFKGPGKYEAKWVQNGKYWNLTSLDMVGASNGAPQASAPAAAASAATPTGALKSGAEIKASIFVAAMDATGHVVSSMVVKGFFGDGSPQDQMRAIESLEGISKGLANEALAWVKGQKSQGSTSGTEGA